jgi:coniferyl-aldehyde dehydrogenase
MEAIVTDEGQSAEVSTAASPEAKEAQVEARGEQRSLRQMFDGLRAAQRKDLVGPSLETRLRHLERLENAIRKAESEIVAAISADFGHRSSHETRLAEIFVVLSGIHFARANLADWMATESREVAWTFAPGSAELAPQPLGVVGIMAPWNYPFQLAIAPLVSALAAGNRALIKPSELVPKTSALIARLINDCFAYDHVTVAVGDAEVGKQFATLPLDHLVFTGSTRVGKLVMRAAAENLVPVTLELGGKSPCIVGDKYSLSAAATSIVSGKLLNAGQTCIAPDYILVSKGRRDGLVSALKTAAQKLFPTFVTNPDYTSIINDAHFGRLEGYLSDAEAKGAKVIRLGTETSADRKFIPALVCDADDACSVMQEEIFGPILPIVTYDSIDEAIAYVNDRPRPLALYLFDRDEDRIEKVLQQTVSGGVTVNDTMLHIAQDALPFGGVGPSGMGHYHGKEGFQTMSKMKPIFRQARLNATGLLRQPFGKTSNVLLKFLIG